VWEFSEDIYSLETPYFKKNWSPRNIGNDISEKLSVTVVIGSAAFFRHSGKNYCNAKNGNTRGDT
jgi:hypothetical protein